MLGTQTPERVLNAPSLLGPPPELGDLLQAPVSITRPDLAPGFAGAESAACWPRLAEPGIAAHHFRAAVERMDGTEPNLRAVLNLLISHKPMTHEVAERVDWLVTYMFRRRLSSGVDTPPVEMLEAIRAWTNGGVPSLSRRAAGLVAELTDIRDRLEKLSDLQALVESNLIPSGRAVKRELHSEWLNPEILTVAVNYNLAARRCFEGLAADTQKGGMELPSDIRSGEYRAVSEVLRRWSAKRCGARRRAEAGQPPAATAAPWAGIACPPSAAGGAPAENSPGLLFLRNDPRFEESRVGKLASDLVLFARCAPEPLTVLPLPNSILVVSPLEFQSLTVDYPAMEVSFRADLNSIVRRAVVLLAAIEDELALYKVRRSSEYLWRQHVNSLGYLLHAADQIVPDMDTLFQQAQERGLLSKAEQLGATIQRLRRRMSEIAELCQQCNNTRAPAAA